MRVAVTRTSPEAETTAERVRGFGAYPVLTPLLTIQAKSFDTDLRGVQALLFTSAAGVRALPNVRFEGLALTVGEASARVALRAGFSSVNHADGDSATLARLARETLDPKAGKLVHISGAHVAGDLVAALRADGFDAERRIAYEAVAATALPGAFGGSLDAVLFHSARAAEIFASFNAPNSAQLIAACLSPAVAKAASVASWKQIIVAPRPREDALLTALLSPTGASA